MLSTQTNTNLSDPILTPSWPPWPQSSSEKWCIQGNSLLGIVDMTKPSWSRKNNSIFQVSLDTYTGNSYPKQWSGQIYFSHTHTHTHTHTHRQTHTYIHRGTHTHWCRSISIQVLSIAHTHLQGCTPTLSVMECYYNTHVCGGVQVQLKNVMVFYSTDFDSWCGFTSQFYS